MDIRILVGDKIRVINTSAFDSKIHKHLSGREFTEQECKNFKPEVKKVEIKVETKTEVKTEDKKILSKKK